MAKAKAAAKPSSSPPSSVADLLNALEEEMLSKTAGGSLYGKKIEAISSGKAILAVDRETQTAIVQSALDRLEDLEARIAAIRSKLKGHESHNPHLQPGWMELWNPRWVFLEMLRALLRRSLPLSEDTL